MPGLGTVPVLGALFRSSGFKRGQTELVIIVTPVIVGPTTPAPGARRRSTATCRRTTSSASCSAASRATRSKAEQVQNRMGQRRLYGASPASSSSEEADAASTLPVLPPARRAALALAAALLLAGCAAQPIGPVRPAPSYQRRHGPGATCLLPAAAAPSSPPGEAERLRRLPRDAARCGRRTTSRSTSARPARPRSTPRASRRSRGAFAGTPARLQVVASPELGRATGRRRASSLVQRNGRLVVTCPNSALEHLGARLPHADAAGSAAPTRSTSRDMAARAARPDRAARGCGGSDGVASVGAVERYRADKVKVIKLDSTPRRGTDRHGPGSRGREERHDLRRRRRRRASRSAPTSPTTPRTPPRRRSRAQRGWSASNIRKGNLGTALRLLGVAPPPRFIIVDIENLPIEEVESGPDRARAARQPGDGARHGQRRQLLPPRSCAPARATTWSSRSTPTSSARSSCGWSRRATA